MAQLSTDTLVYSQIVSLVQDFVNKYISLRTASPEEFNKAYQKVLAEIQSKIGGTSFDLNLIYKGDIPRSESFNQMISMMSKDLNIMTNQLDSMSANYVNTFNVFSNQIEAEKVSLSRIKSKINILEMYSQSPSVDIAFLGDSFDDMSNVDATKVDSGFLPDVLDGYMALPKVSTKKTNSTVRVINENYNQSIVNQVSFADFSNGLKGSHFLFNKGIEGNPFVYEKSSEILRSNESAITDNSPASYFEYEAISVPAESRSQRPIYEFQYFDGSNYVNWADFDITKPLKLTLEFTLNNKSGESLNYFSVTPFFGDDISGAFFSGSNLKISSLKLFNEKENKTYEIINEKNVAYIASDVSQKTLENYKNFFVNKAVFRFDETKVNKIYITFEQSNFKDTVIKHTYWTPYELGKDAKWNNQARFNPEIALDSLNRVPTWDKLALVPKLKRPTELKSAATDSRVISLQYNTEITSETKWQLALIEPKKAAPGSVTSTVMNEFFWYKKDNQYNVDLFATKEYANLYPDIEGMQSIRARLFSYSLSSPCVLIDPTKNDQINSLKIPLKTIQVSSSVATIVTSSNHNLSVGDYFFIRGSSGSLDISSTYQVSSVANDTQFSFDIKEYTNVSLKDISTDFFFCIKTLNPPTENNLQILKFVEKTSKKISKQIVAKRNFEELKVKRASIGIRDISFGKETYQTSAQVISKPFLLSGNLDLLSIYADDHVPNDGQSSIKYSISVDGGNIFYPIQPVERNFTGTPEIIAFNQNLPGDATIPQVLYLDNGKSPGVPNPINSVIVKITMQKSRTTNSTPVVYYYRLGTRYR